jgi:hypothetical protein
MRPVFCGSRGWYCSGLVLPINPVVLVVRVRVLAAAAAAAAAAVAVAVVAIGTT